MPRTYSYIVRYDSGFAPNPFFGICTLATCKPDIRKSAQIGDWVIGTGSGNRSIQRAGKLVYAMKVSETVGFENYWNDPRFRRKRPNLHGSKKSACGDNIYNKDPTTGRWRQLDSFHSKPDGSPNPDHVAKDTSVDRILLSDDFVYFGGSGPSIPAALRNFGDLDLCIARQGRKVFDNVVFIDACVTWIRSLAVHGFVSDPFDWAAMK